jgi:hypothetical protein
MSAAILRHYVSAAAPDIICFHYFLLRLRDTSADAAPRRAFAGYVFAELRCLLARDVAAAAA